MKYLNWVVCLAMTLVLAACSSSNDGISSSKSAGPSTPMVDPGVPGESSDGAYSKDVGYATPGDSPSATGNDVGSGDALASRMTAGLWDDNANFDVFQSYLAQQNTNFPNNLPGFDQATNEAAHNASLQRTAANAIDIALMLDATGSMSDELSYLQTEFSGISDVVVQRFPNISVRWSLLVYRDQNDEYVTRSFNFSSDVAAFRANLAAQSADGGGDEPEAVSIALERTLGQSWRGSAAAQMLVWVADAPHHDGDMASVRSSLALSRNRGIHIYPVAASSASPLAEATMRVAAQTTGGRYLFLTDDSGIGNAHSEPKVPCYTVTSLSDAIIRSVAMEVSGKYVEPSLDSIVRIVGKPVGPQCEAVADAGTQ